MAPKNHNYHAPAQPHIPYALLVNAAGGTKLISIEEVINNQVSAFSWRMRLRKEKAEGGDDHVSLRCPLCDSPLQMKALSHKDGPDHTLYFSHGNHDATSCALAQERSLSRKAIEAMIYDGVRESSRHKRLKSWIAKMAERTPGLAVESLDRRYVTGTGEDGSKLRRKPDILMLQNGSRVAIEVQVSPTFTQVIADRYVAYRKLDIPLVWVADNFNPDTAQAFHKDIVEQNSGYIFSLDDHVRTASEKSGILLLRLWHRRYSALLRSPTWNHSLIQANDINFRLLLSEPTNAFQFSSEINDGLLLQIEERVLERGHAPQIENSQLVKRLEQAGLSELEFDKHLFVLKTLLSIRDGRVYSGQTWKWLANQILDHHSDKLRPIAFAAKAYNRTHELFPPGSKQYKRMRSIWKKSSTSMPANIQSLYVSLLPELQGWEPRIWP